MKNFSKKLLAILVSTLLLLSSFSVLTFGVSAEGKNLISNSTAIDLLRPDKDIQSASQTWSWENGVLTSLDKNREDSNVVFKIDGLDSTKTYCFSGKLKILEFGSDTGWYGPRIIFRGQNRDDIKNADYSALCHFQSTEVFINNFINASTLPYEVTNARAKLNTEMAFEIYVSNDRTVVYYGGKLCFNLKNNARVQKVPLCFGFWTIGCQVQFYDISLTESKMPIPENTSSQGGAATTVATASGSNANTTVKTNSGNTTATTAKADTEITEASDSTTTSANDEEVGTTTSAVTPDDSSSDESSLPSDEPQTQTGAPSWLVPVIIAAIVLLVAAGVLFYFMVIRKKN